MNTEQLFGLVIVVTVLAGFYCGSTANDHIHVRGGKAAMAIAVAIFLLGLTGFAAGYMWRMPVVTGLGTFLFAFEYSWALCRYVDRIGHDGQYKNC